jgi:ribosomal protein S18 acetylase RimI-like enzyme
MLIVTAKELNKIQQSEISRILAACASCEKTALTYPLDDEDTLHIIGYDDAGEPAAAIGMYHISEYSYEAVAFTVPGHRRSGYFKALFAKAQKLLYALHHRQVSITWVTDENSPTAGKAARRIKAKRQSIELQMSLHMNNQYYADRLAGIPPREFRFVPATPTNLVYRVMQSGRTLAVFSLMLYDSSKKAYLYSFEVDRTLRGHGIGSRVFPHILKLAYEKGYTTISLQVSETNKAAYRIYRHAGMKVITRLGYYKMTVG